MGIIKLRLLKLKYNPKNPSIVKKWNTIGLLHDLNEGYDQYFISFMYEVVNHNLNKGFKEEELQRKKNIEVECHFYDKWENIGPLVFASLRKLITSGKLNINYFYNESESDHNAKIAEAYGMDKDIPKLIYDPSSMMIKFVPAYIEMLKNWMKMLIVNDDDHDELKYSHFSQFCEDFAWESFLKFSNK